MDRIRLGVVGTGNIAALNVAGYLEHPACDVVAVCDPRRDVAERFATVHGISHVHDDLTALLADDVDAVEILTPTHLHHEHVLAALAAGKHVSCQKPIATSLADAAEMRDAAETAGLTLRVSECFYHYPPLVRARELVADGAIGTPTVVRVKTVVGTTDSAFQTGLDPAGYGWRFDAHSPGGHLFDDNVHKYAVARWLVGEEVRSVQAVVRRGRLFFEAPTVALFEYERDDLLGTMEVSHAPRMHVRSRYYGADELFEVQGTDGFVWVTRATGELLDLPALVLYRGDTTTTFADLDADWGAGFRGASRHFVDALLAGERPDMTPDDAIRTLQLCFAVYAASNTRLPVEPGTIGEAVSPRGWPPTPAQLHADVEALFADG